MDEGGGVFVDTKWPVNESPHTVTDIMGGLLGAISSGSLDLHITNAVCKFGMENDRRALTQHVLTHWQNTKEKIDKAQTAFIRPSEVFEK